MNNQTLLSILDTGLGLLPPHMDSPAARQMMLAIGWQESRFLHRRQIRGPARGFWQFESGGGTWGVLNHATTRHHAHKVCKDLFYPPEVTSVYPALADNDILATAFARLNLWWVPYAIPTNEKEAWKYYLFSWRPGKPHESSWGDAWAFGKALLS